MSIPFEATRSYVYNASRYELLPKLAEMARVYGEQPFLLRELTKQLLDETYSAEDLNIQVKKAQSDASDRMRTIFGFYVPFLAEKLGVFENLGRGLFKNIPIEEELAEADAVATDVESNDAGLIYAYSFPSIMKRGEKFPIKVGLTTTGNAEARVKQQCAQTCCFDFPSILKVWTVSRVGAVEDAVHSTLEARGAKRNSPGSEWFDTTLDEIDSIIRFVQPGTPD